MHPLVTLGFASSYVHAKTATRSTNYNPNHDREILCSVLALNGGYPVGVTKPPAYPGPMGQYYLCLKPNSKM